MPEKADYYKIIRKLLCQRAVSILEERWFIKKFEYDKKSVPLFSIPLMLFRLCKVALDKSIKIERNGGN